MPIGTYNHKIYKNTVVTRLLFGSHKNMNKNFKSHKAITLFKTWWNAYYFLHLWSYTTLNGMWNKSSSYVALQLNTIEYFSYKLRVHAIFKLRKTEKCIINITKTIPFVNELKFVNIFIFQKNIFFLSSARFKSMDSCWISRKVLRLIIYEEILSLHLEKKDKITKRKKKCCKERPILT